MYSNETLKKLIASAKTLEKQYKKDKSLKVCISKGNRKIGRVMNVSLMPILTCSNCKECMYYCYDIKACMQYPGNVLTARVRNTIMAKLNSTE